MKKTLFLTTLIVQSTLYSQMNYSWELEGSIIASNRKISTETYGFNESFPLLDKLRSESELLPGFYIQGGINFREDKRVRIFTGIRFMDQQVQLIYFKGWNVSNSPSGPNVYGTLTSAESDMFYVSVPVSLKYNVIQKPGFRFTGEVGVLPGILAFISGPKKEYGTFLNLASEISLTFEKKLKSGNSIALRFPSFNFGLTPSDTEELESTSFSQYNYSFGCGIKFVFPNS